MNTVSHILTLDGITVVVRGRPYNVSKGERAYADIVSLIEAGANEETVYDVLTRVEKQVQQACVQLSVDIQFNDGIVLYQGRPLHGYAVDKLVELVYGGKDARPLARFLEKLYKNPSQQTIEHLYTFLEYGRIPITMDGDFLAYKAIRKDWKDIHSGTMDNSIGLTVRMPRSDVDDRRDVTCSRGLHVCSFEYLPSFSHANGHVVVCQINPANVVAIPNDYNNTKMRVSEYKVVGEVEGYYAEHKDILGDAGIWEPKYAVYGRDREHDEWEFLDDFESEEEAVDFAKDMAAPDTDFPEQQWLQTKVVDQELGITTFKAYTR